MDENSLWRRACPMSTSASGQRCSPELSPQWVGQAQRFRPHLLSEGRTIKYTMHDRKPQNNILYSPMVNPTAMSWMF